jgi:hypothetical protein
MMIRNLTTGIPLNPDFARGNNAGRAYPFHGQELRCCLLFHM